MKSLISFALLVCLFLNLNRSVVAQSYPISPVPFTAVKVNDSFWAPRIKRNHEVTIPIALNQCYKTGRIDNFLFAAKTKQGKFCTEFPFDDTDIYKILEGASYSIQTNPDKKLEAKMDTLIDIIGKAQEPDGYLYTARTIDPQHPHGWSGTKRWEKESELSHELYNSGHLFEAAVAHYQATGKKSLLNIAIKNADLLCNVFGPGKLDYEPGHQIVEMGLVKLYNATGKKEYLNLAKFFLDVRGDGGEYSQNHKKVTAQTEAVGHAVRATYMYSGMADVAALVNDKDYIKAIDAIWEDVVRYKYYITGGIGAVAGHEGFGPAYSLPNMSAYNETCAAIGNVYWNYRLFLLHGESKYYDVLERTLYNGLISGVSESGDHFFYPNPLESMGQHERSEWFGCACCPSNVCRFLPSLPGYMYAVNKNRLYINLFIQSKANIALTGNTVELIQETNYPWSGDMTFIVNPKKTGIFEISIRIPGWAQNKPVPSDLYSYVSTTYQPFSLLINGQPAKYETKDGYAIINNYWKKGDKIQYSLPTPVQLVKANDKVTADKGNIAIERGPIVYCLEWMDNKNASVTHFQLDKNTPVKASFKPDMFGGVEIIEGRGKSQVRTENNTITDTENNFTAIPYYTWANRGAGDMAVWVAYEPSAMRPLSPATIASTSKITASHITKTLHALNDQVEPANSHDNAVVQYHWWPKKDTVQWVQYNFAKPAKVSSTDVYWFDDAPWGGCRVPQSWKLLYKDVSGTWKEVKINSAYPVDKDKFNTATFEAVETDALRMEVKISPAHSAGILEWKVN